MPVAVVQWLCQNTKLFKVHEDDITGVFVHPFWNVRVYTHLNESVEDTCQCNYCREGRING